MSKRHADSHSAFQAARYMSTPCVIEYDDGDKGYYATPLAELNDTFREPEILIITVNERLVPIPVSFEGLAAMPRLLEEI